MRLLLKIAPIDLLQSAEETRGVPVEAKRTKTAQDTGDAQVIVVAWRHPVGGSNCELVRPDHNRLLVRAIQFEPIKPEHCLE